MYTFLFKRVFDLTLATISLVVLLPLFMPIIVLLKLTGEHEVFYLQERVGFKNGFFKIWKFTTMVKNSSNMGTGSLTLRNDPRVLPLGKFLRQTKINELPQILNVITGEMSLVGPRPQMHVDFLKFPEHVQRCIYNTKPGITGIGSIIFRDEEKWISNSGMDPHDFYRMHIAPYKGELEIWYQNHISLITDFKLIFLTLWVVISPDSQLTYSIFKDLPIKPEELN